MNIKILKEKLENFDLKEILLVVAELDLNDQVVLEQKILTDENLKNKIIKDYLLLYNDMFKVQAIFDSMYKLASFSLVIQGLHENLLLDEKNIVSKFFHISNIEKISDAFSLLRDDMEKNKDNENYYLNTKGNLKEHLDILCDSNYEAASSYKVFSNMLRIEGKHLAELQSQLFLEDKHRHEQEKIVEDFQKKCKSLNDEFSICKNFVWVFYNILNKLKRKDFQEAVNLIDPGLGIKIHKLKEELDEGVIALLSVNLDIHYNVYPKDLQKAVKILKINNEFNKELKKLSSPDEKILKEDIYENLVPIHNQFLNELSDEDILMLRNKKYNAMRDICLKYKIDKSEDIQDTMLLKKEIKRAKI